MITEEFKKAYKQLNPEQKEAVDTIEGPVMVVAGPGTGKTHVLALRIANILAKTDTRPENILALTFTEAATSNMRRRLASLIGSTAYRVSIQTFHGFCNSIIQNYPEYFPHIIGSSSITEVEVAAILEGIIKKEKLSVLRPWGDPLYYVREISMKIEELKREGISAEEFSKIVSKQKSEDLKKSKIIEKNRELSLIYKKYQEELRKRRLYDWSDMILEVLKILKGPTSPRLRGAEEFALKQILQEEYQYVLVDEHQDTNNAQNKILEILLDYHEDPNVFVVGDEKQAIFRFQGASVENFLFFKKIYPRAKLIELFRNYRSVQHVLDAAHSVIASVTPLTSESKEKKEESKIKIAEFSSATYENYFVAKRVKELIEKNKVTPEEIAIIYRTNREAFPIAHALSKEGVKYVIESDEDLFSEKFVRKLLILLEAIDNFGDDELLVAALHIEELGVDPLQLYKMVRESAHDRKPLYDILKNKKDPAFKKLTDWAMKSKSEMLPEFVERILRESGILDSMVASQDADVFLGIEKFFDEAKRIAWNKPESGLRDFVTYLATLREHKILIKKPKSDAGKNAVRLMTAHKSKGQEFERVFIVNAVEKSFGYKKSRELIPLVSEVYKLTESGPEEEGLEDERRLFYVGLTRAKKEIFISNSRTSEDGKENLPSPFIAEIREDRREFLDTAKFEAELKKSAGELFKEKKTDGKRRVDEMFVRELFRTESLSVTAINNYLECPWKYFYRNLLRIPSVQEKHQIYGSAMHAAIEDLWRAIKDRDVDEKFLIDSYRKHLGEAGALSKSERQEAEAKGSKALKGWFKWARPRALNLVIPEFKINGVLLPDGAKENIILSAKLDKVEFTGEGRVVVTDYKTGKQKTRGFIEGTTKDSNGDMKRQLVFYKMIMRMHSGAEVERACIEFLEPDEKGRYRREEFEIEEKEIEELQEVIKKIAKEITTLAFWDKKCDEKECEYCGYRKLLEK